jgi:C1A family cysteine protease
MKSLLPVLLIFVFTYTYCYASPEKHDIEIIQPILDSFQNKPRKELFRVFHFLLKKPYPLDSEEGINRYKIFKQNLKHIEYKNALNDGITYGITEYTDLTEEEFWKGRTMKSEDLESMRHSLQSTFLESTAFNNDVENYTKFENGLSQTLTIDHKALFGPIKNQGNCGSCWAFAVIGSVEALYAKTNPGKKVTYSEQQLMDCSTDNKGCSGGWIDHSLNYIKTIGIHYSQNYNYGWYSAQQQTCSLPKNILPTKIGGWEFCDLTPNSKYSWPKPCNKNLFVGLLKQAPVAVFIQANPSMYQNYRSGIFDPSKMTCGKPDHVVVAIGWGVESGTGKEFLVIRNSWGSTWGEQGHFRVYYHEANHTCGVSKQAYYPKF